jgi:hypothetical protein
MLGDPRMPPIPPGFWTEATPIGVLLFVLVLLIWGVVSGRLRSNVAVQEIRADRDARVAEYRKQAEDWREAFQKSESAREIQTTIAKEALATSRSTESIVQSLRVALDLATNRGSG